MVTACLKTKLDMAGTHEAGHGVAAVEGAAGSCAGTMGGELSPGVVTQIDEHRRQLLWWHSSGTSPHRHCTGAVKRRDLGLFLPLARIRRVPERF